MTPPRTTTWTRTTTLRYTAPLRPGSVIVAERNGKRWFGTLSADGRIIMSDPASMSQQVAA